MAMSVFPIRHGFGKVDMPTAAYVDSAARASLKLMEMVFVEICAEADFMHMIPGACRHRLTAYSRKTMIVCGTESMT